LDDRSGLPLATVLQGRGDLREPADAGDLPLALDDRLVEARSLVKARRFHEAADVYLQPTPCTGDELWVWAKGAWALYHDGGDDGRALDVCRHINHRWPTVNTLLLEGKLLRRRGDNQAALSVLVEANRILTV
jgi:Flp pilus assembly protein TadD